MVHGGSQRSSKRLSGELRKIFRRAGSNKRQAASHKLAEVMYQSTEAGAAPGGAAPGGDSGGGDDDDIIDAEYEDA